MRDDVDAARTSLETAVAAASLGGSTRITLWAYGWLARVQFVTGEWDDAMVSVAHGRLLADSSGIVLVTPLLEWTAGQIAALRGLGRGGRSRADGRGVHGEYAMMRIPTLLLQGQIAEAHADYPRCADSSTRCAASLRARPCRSPDTGRGRICSPTRWSSTATWPAPKSSCGPTSSVRGHGAPQRAGPARVCPGRLLGARGDIAAARICFDESLAQLDGLPLRYDAARVNFAYGQTLRRAGKRRAADAAISAARELYASLGAATYVARCDRELKAGGLNQVRDTNDGIELTPQEEAVTTLVARGLSNRDVAAELFVSPKTVQYHLTRIYAKLGVRSRAELAALRR